MSDIAKTVGKRLRAYRASLGFSQEKLAEKAGLHPTYIGQVERGEKNLTIESLEKITKALEIPMADVFEKIEDRRDESNFSMKAYDLLSHKSMAEREKFYNILLEIDSLTQK